MTYAGGVWAVFLAVRSKSHKKRAVFENNKINMLFNHFLLASLLLTATVLAKPGPEAIFKDKSYHVDEALNEMGPNTCWTSWECDHTRVCSEFGWCMERPEHSRLVLKDCSYYVDENSNALGPSLCPSSWECTQNRVCSVKGTCINAPIGHAKRIIKEKKHVA